MSNDKEIPEMVNEIFREYNLEKDISLVEDLVKTMENLITSDDMWENAMTDESSRRVLAAAIGVIALKFADVSQGMIDFLNDDETE